MEPQLLLLQKTKFRALLQSRHCVKIIWSCSISSVQYIQNKARQTVLSVSPIGFAKLLTRGNRSELFQKVPYMEVGGWLEVGAGSNRRDTELC